MSVLHTMLRSLLRFESAIAVTAYVIVTSVLMADILSRELFGQAIWGVQKVAVYGSIIAGLVGLGLATAKGKHIRPKFTDAWLPEHWARIATRIGDIVACITFIVAAWVSIDLVVSSYEYEFLAPVLDWPIWPFQMVLPYTFFSTAFRHGVFALQPELRPMEEDQ